MSSLLFCIKKRLLHYTWDIAIAIPRNNEEGYMMPYSKYSVLKNPYKTKWFADPFILSYNGTEAQLLVEEFDINVNRGRIALLRVDVNNSLITDCKIVLDISTHLSYPAIYRVGCDVFVAPENADSGSFNVYIWNPEKEQLDFYQTVLNFPLADATILQNKNDYYLLTTSLPYPNGNVLSVYFSKSLFAGYTKKYDVSFSNNVARMAGAIFKDRFGRIIRPSQDCDGDYGNSVIFQIIELSEKELIAKNIFTLAPNGIKYAGIHTYNSFEGIQVIDLKKYDFPYLYKLKKIIKG